MLLKNSGGLLPLDQRLIHSVAVIGPSAAELRTGGGGVRSSNTSMPSRPWTASRKQPEGGVQVRFALGCPMVGEEGKETDASPAARSARRRRWRRTATSP